MARVLITVGSVEMPAELNDTETARAFLKSLPMQASAQVWGNEVYFSTDLVLPEHDLQPGVPPGTLAYWLPGKAICLFFGQKPASPVTIIGTLRGNPYDLKGVSGGEAVSVRVIDDSELPAEPADVESQSCGESCGESCEDCDSGSTV